MKHKGKWENGGGGFINVYADNTIYTLPSGYAYSRRNEEGRTVTCYSDWGYRKVGESFAMGGIFTQELYDKWYARAKRECVFDDETGNFEKL